MKNTFGIDNRPTDIGISLAARVQNSARDEGGRVLGLENAWNHAIEAKDTKALDMLLGSTFVAVEIDGTVSSKSEFLASIKAPEYQPSQAVTEQIQCSDVRRRRRSRGNFSRQGNGKRQTIRPPRTFHRHLDQTEQDLAMRRQPGHSDHCQVIPVFVWRPFASAACFSLPFSERTRAAQSKDLSHPVWVSILHPANNAYNAFSQRVSPCVTSTGGTNGQSPEQVKVAAITGGRPGHRPGHRTKIRHGRRLYRALLPLEQNRSRRSRRQHPETRRKVAAIPM